MRKRHVEIIKFVAEGVSNKAIAMELGISVKTVEKHRAVLMQEYGLHNAAEVTRFAYREGLIQDIVQCPKCGHRLT